MTNRTGTFDIDLHILWCENTKNNRVLFWNLNSFGAFSFVYDIHILFYIQQRIRTMFYILLFSIHYFLINRPVTLAQYIQMWPRESGNVGEKESFIKHIHVGERIYEILDTK